MKRVFPQESAAVSHSLSSNESQQMALGGSRRVQTSAAMLGIAISFGASASLLTEPQSALAADGSVITVLPSATDDLAEPAVPRLVVSPEDGPSTAYYTVEDGDSLWQIAAEHHTDVQVIKSANGISPNEVLQAGQVIRVPAGAEDDFMVSSEAAPRLALAGGVGGDFSADAAGTLPLAVPSVDELEQSWDSSDASALTPQRAQAAGTSAEVETDAAVTVAAQSAPSVSTAVSSKPAAEAPAMPEAEALNPKVDGSAEASVSERNAGDLASLEAEWHDESVAVDSAASGQEATDKPLELAILDSAGTDRESAIAQPSVISTLPYTVKPGDTFWNIASRHGLSSEELLSHNQTLESPEDIAVGDSINIPVNAVAESESTAPEETAVIDSTADSVDAADDVAETTTEPTLGRGGSTALAIDGHEMQAQSREAFIQEHLARIRSSANSGIDREALNARIRAARQSLAVTETKNEAESPAALEYYDTADEVASAPATSTNQSEPTITPALASNIRSLQQTSLQRPSAQAASWSVTDAAATTPDAEMTALVEEPSSTEELADTEASATPDPSLMAAAPLNPDVYQVAPSLPVGQTVSPDMPILPESGEFLPEVPNRFNGYTWPARGTLTSGYGWRWGRMHRGIDIAGPVGTPILAAAPGVVVRSGWNSGGYGNLVDIRHADGSMTRYAHNSRLLVSEGQQVQQGQQIAEMGSTGYSTGPHLHFEVHLPNSGTVNPMAHLPSR